MDMLLRNTTEQELADILARHRDRSSAALLGDATVRLNAVDKARKNGIWDDLNQMNPQGALPVVRRSVYQEFQRTGERTRAEQAIGQRRHALSQAALALWLDHPAADLDYLQDLIWAVCEEHRWVLPASADVTIDLSAASLAATVAEIVDLFRDRMEPEVPERVHTELCRRIYDPLGDWARSDYWTTVRNNWNLICNGEIIRTALYDLADPTVAAHLIHPLIQHLTYALDGFTDDGGCVEGPSYWEYGFGHFVKTAWALYQKTAGEVNLMVGDKIQAICRFPLATDIAAPTRATFSDARSSFIAAETALLINRFYPIPELYALVASNADRSLHLTNLDALALDRNETLPDAPDLTDYYLPDLGFVKLRGQPGPEQFTVTALGGDNGVSHNHNDLGSFILASGGTVLLTDPGSPVYRRTTFSGERYQTLHCNSFGHSVPIIDGQGQPPGPDYFALMTVTGLQADADKAVTIDLTHAYAPGLLNRAIRTITVLAHGAGVRIDDAFDFRSAVSALDEAFVTFGTATIVSPTAVRVAVEAVPVTIHSQDPGHFHLDPRPESSPDDPEGRLLTRVIFVPDSIPRQLRLSFLIR